jgi:hypothetical protein
MDEDEKTGLNRKSLVPGPSWKSGLIWVVLIVICGAVWLVLRGKLP